MSVKAWYAEKTGKNLILHDQKHQLTGSAGPKVMVSKGVESMDFFLDPWGAGGIVRPQNYHVLGFIDSILKLRVPMFCLGPCSIEKAI